MLSRDNNFRLPNGFMDNEDAPDYDEGNFGNLLNLLRHREMEEDINDYNNEEEHDDENNHLEEDSVDDENDNIEEDHNEDENNNDDDEEEHYEEIDIGEEHFNPIPIHRNSSRLNRFQPPVQQQNEENRNILRPSLSAESIFSYDNTPTTTNNRNENVEYYYILF